MLNKVSRIINSLKVKFDHRRRFNSINAINDDRVRSDAFTLNRSFR